MSAQPVDVLAVVAVVTINGEEALVLNRPLALVYEQVGRDFFGSDGPFQKHLKYERASEMFRAFAGSELTLPMRDGSTRVVKDHWWSHHPAGLACPPVSDAESLRRCYVFRGGLCIAPDDLAALRATYDGPVYGYREYEKHLKGAALARCGGAV
jgi:hypothetical protein